jgi:hypothetical protein
MAEFEQIPLFNPENAGETAASKPKQRGGVDVPQQESIPLPPRDVMPVEIVASKHLDDLISKTGELVSKLGGVTELYSQQNTLLKDQHRTLNSMADSTDKIRTNEEGRNRATQEYLKLIDRAQKGHKGEIDALMRQSGLVENISKKEIQGMTEEQRRAGGIELGGRTGYHRTRQVFRVNGQMYSLDKARDLVMRYEGGEQLSGEEKLIAEHARSRIIGGIDKPGRPLAPYGPRGILQGFGDALKTGRGVAPAELLNLAKSVELGPWGAAITALIELPRVMGFLGNQIRSSPLGQILPFYQQQLQQGQIAGGGFREGYQMYQRESPYLSNVRRIMGFGGPRSLSFDITRPNTWFDVIGQQQATQIVQGVRSRGYRGGIADALDQTIASSIRDLGISPDSALNLLDVSVRQSGETIRQFRQELKDFDVAARAASMGQEEYMQSLMTIRSTLGTGMAYSQGQAGLSQTQLSQTVLSALPPSARRGDNLQATLGFIQQAQQQFGVIATGQPPWLGGGQFGGPGQQMAGMDYMLRLYLPMARQMGDGTEQGTLSSLAYLTGWKGNINVLHDLVRQHERGGGRGLQRGANVQQGIQTLRADIEKRRGFRGGEWTSKARRDSFLSWQAHAAGQVIHGGVGEAMHGAGQLIKGIGFGGKPPEESFHSREEALTWAHIQGQSDSGLYITHAPVQMPDGTWKIRLSRKGATRMSSVIAARENFLQTYGDALNTRQKRFFEQHISDQKFNVQRFLRHQGLIGSKSSPWGTNANVAGIVEVRLHPKDKKHLQVRTKSVNSNAAARLAADQGYVPTPDAYDSQNRTDRMTGIPNDFDLG